MTRKLFLLVLICRIILVNAQIIAPQAPEKKDFEGIYKFLASDWFQGREAGEKGGIMAADYIASEMQALGLLPFGQIVDLNKQGFKNNLYFQDFELKRYKIEKSCLSLVRKSDNSSLTTIIEENLSIAYPIPCYSIKIEAPLIFAGYGLSLPEKNYDEYKGLDVKSKIVVILNQFPGKADKNSDAYKKFGKELAKDENLLQKKIQMARNKGALAVLIINDLQKNIFEKGKVNSCFFSLAMDANKKANEAYSDFEYILPTENRQNQIPVIHLDSNTAILLLEEFGIQGADYEHKAANLAAKPIENQKPIHLNLSIEVKSESLLVRNVIGMIPGRDQNRYVIVGAHYDHLGAREERIYNGADDNASGVAGMLSLAKKWKESNLTPDCNILFAAWTAEEKGLLGSQHFVNSIGSQAKSISHYLNLDMISGSAVEDSAKNMLSIGLRKADKELRELAIAENSNPDIRFVLDLWEVDGHSGSDYASFLPHNIPVLTFNSGLHNDYHTPRDVFSRADLNKMEKVLKLVQKLLNKLIFNN